MTPVRAIAVVIGLAIAVYALFALDVVYPDKVDDFATCVAAGNAVMESYPRQCRDEKTGTLYVETVAQPGIADRIKITSPASGATVSSPVRLSGEAVGGWYFEASFPVQILDANGTVIGQGPIQAKGDWMTADFVPFSTDMTFSKPTTATGVIRFMNDNPSGLPENQYQVDIPVTFADFGAGTTTSRAPGAYDGCVITGCSSQICGEESMMSTCEYREVYMCYKTAVCEKQSTGKCGWTETAQLAQCVSTNS